MSRVTINEAAIKSLFERHPVSNVIGPTNPKTQSLARRMVRQAQRNASGAVVRRRTGRLAESVEPIIRVNPRTGAVQVGVGTTSEYGGFLENGTPAHRIPNKVFFRGLLKSAPGHPDPLPHPTPSVQHPGFEAKRWLQQAVDSVIGRG